MNRLVLVVLALLAVGSVYSVPKIDNEDISMQQLMEKMKKEMPEDSEETAAILHKLADMFDSLEFDLDDLTSSAEVVGEIGPNFDVKHFIASVKRNFESSWQKRCMKVSGDADAYEKLDKADDEAETCLEEYDGYDELELSYNQTQATGELKPLLKSICKARSKFFGCADNYLGAVNKCLFPSEMSLVHKVDRFNKNLMDLVCAHEADDFALFNMQGGDGMKCVQQSMAGLKTCANKAIFKGTERFLSKWIENEHFNYAFEPEDCMAFDEIKGCFVSSVESCAPKAKEMVSSIFQLIHDETKC